MKKFKNTFICLLVALLASAASCHADQKDFTYPVRDVTVSSGGSSNSPAYKSTTTATADLSGTTLGTLTEGPGSKWSIDSTGLVQIALNFTGTYTKPAQFVFVVKDKQGNPMFSLGPMLFPARKGSVFKSGTVDPQSQKNVGSIVQTIRTL